MQTHIGAYDSGNVTLLNVKCFNVASKNVNRPERIHESTISGIILRVFRLEVSVFNVYITNQFQTTFAQESVSEGDRDCPITSKNSASGKKTREVNTHIHRNHAWQRSGSLTPYKKIAEQG
jgi:hypothetical protein